MSQLVTVVGSAVSHGTLKTRVVPSRRAKPGKLVSVPSLRVTTEEGMSLFASGSGANVSYRKPLGPTVANTSAMVEGLKSSSASARPIDRRTSLGRGCDESELCEGCKFRGSRLNPVAATTPSE